MIDPTAPSTQKSSPRCAFRPSEATHLPLDLQDSHSLLTSETQRPGTRVARPGVAKSDFCLLALACPQNGGQGPALLTSHSVTNVKPRGVLLQPALSGTVTCELSQLRMFHRKLYHVGNQVASSHWGVVGLSLSKTCPSCGLTPEPCSVGQCRLYIYMAARTKTRLPP